jgi:hypothetical protein
LVIVGAVCPPSYKSGIGYGISCSISLTVRQMAGSDG